MMAILFPHFKEHYKPGKNAAGQWIGDVYTIGNGAWLVVCPLCGHAHDVTLAAKLKQATYEPKCSVAWSHPAAFRQWLKEWPEARAGGVVALMFHAVMPTYAIETKKPARKSAAARLKKQVEQDYALKSDKFTVQEFEAVAA